ncbi:MULTISPECIES: hypothetical protein [unclassified Polaribacter]|jgi:hypothetical protein|uniref:hypothetical protein n=1 Tax=unclassified Polaribacter TaxID=196858 RepID=UPI00052C5E1B|nr:MULTISPECIES: hypothetical protein [unclassified Polaribacter]KGL61015.1 hypothetical protein PHEL49_1909 [Polaribacter sp. Hel1_33_49]MBT7815235.1 hypothetical protein [Polaribacter sp.]PKV64698.1 hypothetical protein ATE90_1097 [Polaribacter sp. Hel1_33_96]
MRRVIVEYAKLTTDILDLLVDKYPNGYDYSDIISYKNAKAETIKALEVKTEDAVYLVKISSKLEQVIEDYAEDEDSFNANDDFDVNDV